MNDEELEQMQALCEIQSVIAPAVRKFGYHAVKAALTSMEIAHRRSLDQMGSMGVDGDTVTKWYPPTD